MRLRLRLRLPKVRPEEYVVPLSCPYGCAGHYVALHAQCRKAIRDPNYQEVPMRRYKCVKCGRSFRRHPTGVSGHHHSQRLRGIGVMLYVLRLSYGGVADALRPFLAQLQTEYGMKVLVSDDHDIYRRWRTNYTFLCLVTRWR